MEALLQVPEFVRAYEPDGLTVDEFESLGATRRTLRGFMQADADLGRSGPRRHHAPAGTGRSR